MPVHCRLPTPLPPPPPQRKKTFTSAFADILPVHVLVYFDRVPTNFQQKLTKIILYKEKPLREYSLLPKKTTQKNRQRPEPGQLDLGISLQRNVKLTNLFFRGKRAICSDVATARPLLAEL